MSSSESESEAAVSEEEAQDVSDDKRTEIRNKLANMSFEDIQKLKTQMGAKLYNETVFGIKKNPKTNFKRANKNRPREMTSKKFVRLSKPSVAIPAKKAPTPRDPRFDPSCGEYDEELFKSNYGFLKDIRKKERSTLEKEFKTCQDEERKKQIRYLMQRMDNQIREQEKREKVEQEAKEERKEIREKLKRGEKPVFKRKSEKRIEGLINKYEELKKTNKLQKHIEKRTKKLKVKDRKQNKLLG